MKKLSEHLTESFEQISETFVNEDAKPSWAVLTAKMNSSTYYSWMRNDGYLDEIMSAKEFKIQANKAADRLASKHFNQHVGGSAKIYTDKQKFISDYERLSGNKPNLD